MAEIIKARVWQKVDTESNWNANPLILGPGEQAFVVNSAGLPINFKVGDGTKRFSNLPWSIQYAGGQYIQIVGNVLPAPTVDAGYSLVGPGTYTFAGQADVVAPEGRLSQLLWDGTSWILVDMGELPQAENKIPDWIAGTYTTGQQVNHDNTIWAVKQGVTSTTQEPSTDSTEWEAVIKSRLLADSEYLMINWFDKSLVQSGKIINGMTGAIVNNANAKWSGYQKVEDSTDYVISGLNQLVQAGQVRTVWMYDASFNVVGSVVAGIEEGTASFRTAPLTKYIGINITINGIQNDNINTLFIHLASISPKTYTSYGYQLKNYLKPEDVYEGGVLRYWSTEFNVDNITLVKSGEPNLSVRFDDFISNMKIDFGTLSTDESGTPYQFHLRALGWIAAINAYQVSLFITTNGALLPNSPHLDIRLPEGVGSVSEGNMNLRYIDLPVGPAPSDAYFSADIDWAYLDKRSFSTNGVSAIIATLNKDNSGYIYGGYVTPADVVSTNNPMFFKAVVNAGITYFPNLGNLKIEVEYMSLVEIFYNGDSWSYVVTENYGKDISEYILETDNGTKVTPNEFTGSQNERIQSAIAFIKSQGGGVLELGLDTVTVPNTRTWRISEAIEVPSNTTIFLNDSTLKLIDYTFDNVIRNDGIVVDPLNPNGFANEVNANENIRIIGTGVGKSFIEGVDNVYTAPPPNNPGGGPIPWEGDFFGWRGITIAFANVKNYEIAGISFSKSQNWTITQENGCENMDLHHLSFNTTRKNGDGINFRGGCKNARVWEISGDTQDDLIAMTCIQHVDDTPRVYFSNRISKVADYGDWVIEDISINGVSGSSNTHMIIILPASGGKINNIRISNVEERIGGRTATATIEVYSGYGTAAVLGDATNISVNKVIAKTSPIAVRVATALLNSQVNFIRNERDGQASFVLSGNGVNSENLITSNIQA